MARCVEHRWRAGYLVVATFLVGCATWEPMQMSSLSASPALAREIRLHFQDGRILDLTAARVSGDSVVGLRGFGPSAPGDRVAVPTHDIVSLEARHLDTESNLFLAFGLLVLTVAAVALAVLRADHS